MTLVKNHDHTIRRSKVILLDNKNTRFNGRFAAHCSGWTHIEMVMSKDLSGVHFELRSVFRGAFFF